MTRVLYVEDEPILAIAMEGTMQGLGFTVRLAHDGGEGLACARDFQPQIIVTDYMMPRVDGRAMVHMLRQEGMHVPIILTTAVPEKDLNPEFRQQFDFYLGKPFTEQALAVALRQAMTELDNRSPEPTRMSS